MWNQYITISIIIQYPAKLVLEPTKLDSASVKQNRHFRKIRPICEDGQEIGK